MHMRNADAWKLYAEVWVGFLLNLHFFIAATAQLGERQTEDLKVLGSKFRYEVIFELGL